MIGPAPSVNGETAAHSSASSGRPFKSASQPNAATRKKKSNCD
jgi:hypothetical protein